MDNNLIILKTFLGSLLIAFFVLAFRQNTAALPTLNITEQHMAAVQRKWSASETCYDGSSKTYFFRIGEQDISNGMKVGWYMLRITKFIELSNGTSVLHDYRELSPTQPDVSNLFCNTSFDEIESNR